MPIAELFLGAFLQVLFDRLASRELLNFVRREGIDTLLKKWEKMLISIKQVLDDAEDRQLRGDLGVNSWLEDLRNLAYDIEDLLDEFAIVNAENKSEEEAPTSKIGKAEAFRGYLRATPSSPPPAPGSSCSRF